MIYAMKAKKLPDGSMLVMVRWTSDAISPGREMYGLDLHEASICSPCITSYPEDFENFTRAEIGRVYNSIKSARNFYFLNIQRKNFLAANRQSSPA